MMQIVVEHILYCWTLTEEMIWNARTQMYVLRTTGDMLHSYSLRLICLPYEPHYSHMLGCSCT
jgi:hypothetical protein